MKILITGIHHITAIARDPQPNIDFYTKILGLRLVKRTVNFDDPSAYHLYYGDLSGSAGTIVTFFYWPANAARGRIGSGQTTALVFSVAPGSLGFWEAHLRAEGIEAQRIERFGEETLQLADPDHIPVEIVAVSDDPRQGWTGTGIPPEHALRGLHTAELTLNAGDATAKLLTGNMGFRFVREDGNRARYEVGTGGSGSYADVIVDPGLPRGIDGPGTIHHIAWSVPDDAAQARVHGDIRSAGLQTSDVRDRDYFRSIYYREPGRILFEVATEVPGFTVDERLDQLGRELRIPQQFASFRDRIEKALPVLKI